MSFAVALVVSACAQPAPAAQGPSGSPVSTPATVSPTATPSPAPAAMPLGAVMFFRTATCPEGWSELVEAKGRTLVGLSPGGKLEATVGDLLGDLENRAHGHSIGPIVATTSEAPAHSHVVDPPARRTFGFESARVRVIGAFDSGRWISTSQFHSHIVDIPPFDSSARGEHAHGLTVPARQATVAAAVQVMPYVQLQACRNDSATTPALPAAAVTFFDLASCPSGWSELAEARGRTVVGASTRGTVQGTVGDPLGDLENRAHSHAVGPVSVSTTVSESHAHGADPPPLTVMSSVDSAFVLVQGNLFNTVRWIEDAPRHSHQLDHGPLNVSLVAGHAHQVTIPQAQSTVARTGQVMPYVQLLACRNDSPTTPAMPAGAVTFFSLAGCSADWSEMTEARGRALVGLGSGGTLHGTVGDALRDVEDRTHTHAVGQINLTTSVQPAHGHHITPRTNFEYTSLSASGSGKVEFGTDEYAYILNVETHQHEFQLLADGFASAPVGEHSHQVSISPVQTSAARTSQVMSYLQLLACRKG